MSDGLSARRQEGPGAEGPRHHVIDRDGALANTDLLLESFFALISAHPLAALATLRALPQGRAAFSARVAESAVAVGALPLNELTPSLIRERRPSPSDYARALRVHQWLKNLLIFVPAAAAHAFGLPLAYALLAFVSFSLCASSVYILNDLLDLSSDREHRTKRQRPFAAGLIPLWHGVALVPALLATAAALALLLPWRFILVLAGYYALTLAYSVWLKRKMLVDVITLACLYGMRLLAGGAAVGVALSPWLGALSIFLFLSLALIKRCTELVERQRDARGDPPGRGYRLADLPALEGMAAASGYLSVLVLALYFNSPAVTALYSSPTRLWLICVVALYWVSRVLLLAHRGEMHDDPVVFAATDRVSQLAVLLTGAVVLASL